MGPARDGRQVLTQLPSRSAEAYRMPDQPDVPPAAIVLTPDPDRLRRWIAAAAADGVPIEQWLAEAADTAYARGSAR